MNPNLDINKIQQITRPRLAIQKKLGIWKIFVYEKGPRVIRLDLESNTNILDEYFEYLPSRVKQNYSCF